MTNTKESDVGDTYLVGQATPGGRRRVASQAGQSSSLVTIYPSNSYYDNYLYVGVIWVSIVSFNLATFVSLFYGVQV